jgi:polysaccharide export outer membrane protein
LQSTYVLGPQDQIQIRVLEVDELGDKPLRIDDAGEITVPLVGTVKAVGRTLREFEQDLSRRFQRFIREPQVSVTLVEMRSQPVSVIGAVNAPGVHQLQGKKRLVELLSMAGGLRQEAGHHVKITRRRKEWGEIPLPDAVTDTTGEFSIAQVELRGMMEARNPAANIEVRPHDVIAVPQAEMVYVVGDVRKPGGFVLGYRENVSVLQALALAEGLERTASPKHARILRMNPATEKRVEMPVDMGKILAGRASDVPLQADDVLFVPGSAARRASWRLLESALQLGTGVVIYRR